MICPNLSIPDIKKEFDELKSVLGEDMAYLIWDRNGGYGLDKTKDGKPSKLFNDLLGLTDRKGAIEIKAKTLSKSFKQWFGDSKVVDENGEPLIVYHGTNNIFSEFKKGINESIYTTPLKNYSEVYGKSMPLFLKIDSLLNVSTLLNDDSFKDFLKNNEGNGFDLKDLFNTKNQVLISLTNRNFLIDYYKSKGFDGLKGSNEFSVFEPNQIKSIFNTGVFNRYSDNIYDNEIINQETNRQQTSIDGSMSQEIVSNFENYFPDYSHFNDEQRKIIADLVEQGRIQLSCTI